MDEEIVSYLESQGYTQVHSGAEFLEMYPPNVYGKYRPQPDITPDCYPCMVLEVRRADTPDGKEAVLNILY